MLSVDVAGAFCSYLLLLGSFVDGASAYFFSNFYFNSHFKGAANPKTKEAIWCGLMVDLF